MSEYNNPLFKQCYIGGSGCVGRHETVKLLDRKTTIDQWIAKRAQ